DAAALQRAANGGDVQVVTELNQVKRLPPAARPGEEEPAADTLPVSRGPVVARWLLLALVMLLALGVVLAWRFGSARAAPIPGLDPTAAPQRDPITKGLLWTLAHWPLLAVLAVAGVLAHAAVTGRLLSFLPSGARRAIETLVGVPPAPPGEE